MSEVKLLNCPFCGRKAEMRYNKDGFAYVLCANDGCYARTDGCLNENEASRLWNTRKPMERILKRLNSKKVLEYVASVKDSKEETLINGYVKGIKKAIEICKEAGGIE